MYQSQSSSFAIPLSFEAHALAEQFCRQQSKPQKAKQVYLNTLAVWAVDFYLRCLGIETEVDKSDSRNSLFLKFTNVADLWVKSLGRLECCPILPQSSVMEIPVEAQQERVGYVAVRLEKSLKQATLIGFTQTAIAKVSLNQLQSIADLPEFLARCRSDSLVSVEKTTSALVREKKPVSLENRLLDIFEKGWQTLEEFVIHVPPQLAYRVTASKPKPISEKQQEVYLAKRLQLEANYPESQVILKMVISPVEDEEAIDIKVELHPAGESIYLLPYLQMCILDEFGNPVEGLFAQAQHADNWLQLAYRVKPTESSSIQVTLGDSSAIEVIAFSG